MKKKLTDSELRLNTLFFNFKVAGKRLKEARAELRAAQGHLRLAKDGINKELAKGS